MRKRPISVCIAVISVFSFYGCARTAEVTPVAETENREAESEEAADTEDTEAESGQMTASGEEYTQCEEETELQTVNDIPQEQDELEPYYGYYRISEFLPSREWMRGIRYDGLPTQEADMLLGRVVELGEEKLVTYDSFRRLLLNMYNAILYILYSAYLS